jgi:peptide/nickel transport system substrate-binding protein
VSQLERNVSEYRRGCAELENHVIDELVAGRIGRREFLRRGSVLGISASGLALVLQACGGGDSSSDSASSAGGTPASAAKQGGTLRVGVITPTSAVDPVTAGDFGGINMILVTGEYLAVSDEGGLKLEGVLAEKWTPNDDASVWTYTIRQGVTFHDGRPLTARDVAATFNRLADPANGSNALSAFKGILGKCATSAVDERTVRFELDAANGNFPYLTSSHNYNAIILPADYDGDYQKTFVGTGAMKLERFNAGSGATFVANPDYWDKANQPKLDRIEYRFFNGEQPQILALQGGEIDVITQVTVGAGRALLNDPNVNVLGAKSAASRAVHLRTDVAPWNDKRTRQALALSLDRPAIITTLFMDRADVGNDSPFAPVFESTDPSVPQREKDIERARQLLADAGHPDGFTTDLTAINIFEVPDYAVLIKNAAAEIGITLNVKVQDSGTYYGKAKFGSSPWLDSTMGITDYSHRGVPNVYLNAQLRSDGIWNSSHIKSPELDQLVDDYTVAVDIQDQRAAAGKLQTYLLDETPIVYSYFYNFLTATRPNVTDLTPRPGGRIFVAHAGLKA